MNEIVKTFSLAEVKFMSDMHLTQLEFMYSACGPRCKRFKMYLSK